jgi:putative oxidoreductase
LRRETSVEPDPYLPAVRRIYEPLQPYGLTILRVALGVYLMLHGYPKVFEGCTTGLAGLITKMGWPAPLLSAYLVAAAEFGGGLLIAIGFLTRLAAAAVLIEFVVIVSRLKLANGFFAMAPKAIQPGYPGLIPGGYELELLLGLLALAFVITGAGRLSVDHAIGREL